MNTWSWTPPGQDVCFEVRLVPHSSSEFQHPSALLEQAIGKEEQNLQQLQSKRCFTHTAEEQASMTCAVGKESRGQRCSLPQDIWARQQRQWKQQGKGRASSCNEKNHLSMQVQHSLFLFRFACFTPPNFASWCRLLYSSKTSYCHLSVNGSGQNQVKVLSFLKSLQTIKIHKPSF